MNDKLFPILLTGLTVCLIAVELALWSELTGASITDIVLFRA